LSLVNENTEVRAANVIVTQCALHHFQYATQTNQPYYPPQQQQPQAQQQEQGEWGANGNA
jgi:hypothetical protein